MENRVSHTRFVSLIEEKVVVPNRWQGETDCLVGPFSSRTVAEYFASSVVNNSNHTTTDELLVKGDSWYLVIRPLETSSRPAVRSAEA